MDSISQELILSFIIGDVQYWKHQYNKVIAQINIISYHRSVKQQYINTFLASLYDSK